MIVVVCDNFISIGEAELSSLEICLFLSLLDQNFPLPFLPHIPCS